MRGKVLGYSAADGSGAITADDGARYRFSVADWRGDRLPTAGMAVDFEEADGVAKEIYSLGTSPLGSLGNVKIGMGTGATLPGAGRITGIFKQSLAAPLALAVLAACFFPAISSPQIDVSLFNLDKVLDTIAAPSGMVAEMFGMGGASDLGMTKTMLLLRFAAPLAGLWLIWTAWSGKNERLPLLVAGGAAILGAALIFMTRSTVVSVVPEMMRSQFETVISIGLGAWLLLLIGAAMIAAGLGFIKNPLQSN